MSVERELLKECRLMLDNPINGTAGRNLQIRITELFAQPEQEPVAWMWDEMFCDDWTTVSSVIKPSKSEYVDNIQPLYTSSPKRNPLTPRQGLEEYKKGYMIGYNVAVRDLKTKIDSVFNLIMED